MREEKIRHLIQEILDDEKYQDFFLVSIKAPDQSHRMQVFLDGDSGINFATCQSISRELEKTLDTVDWIPDNYILEVSSPGADKPLVLLRQYGQHIGRTLKITSDENEKIQGTLEDVSDNVITIIEEKTIKQGKKKERVVETIKLDFDKIKEAIVKISFK